MTSGGVSLDKLRNAFSNRPASMTLVFLAVVCSVVGAFTAPAAMNAVASTLLVAALVFGIFFDL